MTRPVQSMGERVVQGFLYPISGGEVFTILGLGILSAIPFIGWIAGPAAIFIVLDIVRTTIVNSILSVWVLFYASHLLGYAVYRHAPELGWE